MVLEGVSGTGQTAQQQQTAQNSSGGGISGAVTDSLDKNQFLKILMSQLKNQNPMDPMKNKEFVGQMAQLTNLEQMTQITDSFETFQQSARSRQFMTLLGDNVKIKTKAGGSLTGEVNSVKFNQDSTSVVIGSETVKTNQIASISTNDGNNSGSGG